MALRRVVPRSAAPTTAAPTTAAPVSGTLELGKIIDSSVGGMNVDKLLQTLICDDHNGEKVHSINGVRSYTFSDNAKKVALLKIINDISCSTTTTEPTTPTAESHDRAELRRGAEIYDNSSDISAAGQMSDAVEHA